LEYRKHPRKQALAGNLDFAESSQWRAPRHIGGVSPGPPHKYRLPTALVQNKAKKENHLLDNKQRTRV
jgi:hypothetical protein